VVFDLGAALEDHFVEDAHDDLPLGCRRPVFGHAPPDQLKPFKSFAWLH
jgi:hypothetical protein